MQQRAEIRNRTPKGVVNSASSPESPLPLQSFLLLLRLLLQPQSTTISSLPSIIWYFCSAHTIRPKESTFLLVSFGVTSLEDTSGRKCCNRNWFGDGSSSPLAPFSFWVFSTPPWYPSFFRVQIILSSSRSKATGNSIILSCFPWFYICLYFWASINFSPYYDVVRYFKCMVLDFR